LVTERQLIERETCKKSLIGFGEKREHSYFLLLRVLFARRNPIFAGVCLGTVTGGGGNVL
jgi:hypothetical protein